MTQEEFVLEFGEADALLLKQYEQVVNQVGGLVNEAVAIAVNGFDDRFAGLFKDFLPDDLRALDEELGRIGTVGHLYSFFV